MKEIIELKQNNNIEILCIEMCGLAVKNKYEYSKAF